MQIYDILVVHRHILLSAAIIHTNLSELSIASFHFKIPSQVESSFCNHFSQIVASCFPLFQCTLNLTSRRVTRHFEVRSWLTALSRQRRKKKNRQNKLGCYLNP